MPVPGSLTLGNWFQGSSSDNKDSYLILEKLPAEYDSRVKVHLIHTPHVECHRHRPWKLMKSPLKGHSDIGGCDKQINELIEQWFYP